MRKKDFSGADEVRWPPRSSKPLFCRKAMGGFDSLAFPPNDCQHGTRGHDKVKVLEPAVPEPEVEIGLLDSSETYSH